MSAEEVFLDAISRAIERVVGPRKVSLGSYLKKDLDLESIDLVDMGFELEQLVDFRFDSHELYLHLRSVAASGTDDVQVKQVAQFLLMKRGER
jgi:acyl carrier protein